MLSLKKAFSAAGLVALAVTVQALSFSPNAAGESSEKQNSASLNQVLAQETSLIRLKKSESLWTVLEDEDVKALMKSAMGADLDKYFNATQITELPDVKGADIYAAGGVRGLFTISESFFDLNMNTKKVCICVLSDGKLSIYGVDSMSKIPEPVKEYIDDVRSRLHSREAMLSNEELPKLCFAKAKREESSKLAALPAQKKHLNFSELTGSYSRVDTEPRFEGADFRVVSLPGNKINFCCQALNGAHTGEASGVVPIKNNTAVYDFEYGTDYGYRLIMRFDGKYVYVDQVGEGFGGIGVTASGVYQKVDDQAPQILQN